MPPEQSSSVASYRNRSHYFCAFSLNYTLPAIDLKKKKKPENCIRQTRDVLQNTWLLRRKHSPLEWCKWCDFAGEQSFKSLSNTQNYSNKSEAQSRAPMPEAWSLHRHLSYFRSARTCESTSHRARVCFWLPIALSSFNITLIWTPGSEHNESKGFSVSFYLRRSHMDLAWTRRMENMTVQLISPCVSPGFYDGTRSCQMPGLLCGVALWLLPR